ncbi:MAG: HAMP domain-containing histidine kinase [Candidatus Omnitrophota bacterium]|nr:MAG: HAMP domain-containing histidine kinase [Candidatus Omnitrophota bacterium]
MKFSWKEKRIDFYIACVIIASIILSVLALWAMNQQYNFVNYILKTNPDFSFEEGDRFLSFGRVSIFAFSMVMVSLLLILVIGTYLSSRDVQRQVEVARLKSDFVSVVSHELKTPLTSIRLLAERLLSLKFEEREKQKEYHRLILIQSCHLSHLIGNILDFSKLEEEGKQRYKFEKTDLARLLEQAIEDYPVEFIRTDCKLAVDIASGIPLFYLDREGISRAFINLLDNALKVSPSGGVIKITVGQLSEREAFVEVQDHGPGIAEEEKKKIFERFYHTGKGTGLGLTLVHHIVKSHNGRIELESSKGKGSVFRIILPLRDKE